MTTQLFREVADNTTLWVSILSFAVAQLIKIFIDLGKKRKIDFSLLISSGGMPSSHSAFVCAMTTAIGFREGFDSSLFAVSAIISMVVMYDAAGVRRAAGTQAAILNRIMENAENLGFSLDKKLKELLGHTPIQVACGAALGIFLACVFSRNL